MKIDVISDLHMEFSMIEVSNREKSDVLVLAGDIIPAVQIVPNIIEWFERVAEQYKQVFYVAGNHEYYGSDLLGCIPVIRQMLSHIDNLVIMDNDAFSFNGILFIGGTAWTNLSNPMAQVCATKLTDYSQITFDGTLITPSVIHARHETWKEIASFLLEMYNSTPVVMITHHAPSRQSIHRAYANDFYLNESFCNNLDYQFQHSNLKLWIHGHVHTPFDYQMSDTCRVVCNPRGYVDETTLMYQPQTIEI